MAVLPLSLLLSILLFFLASMPFMIISQTDEQSLLVKLKRELGDPPILRSWDEKSPPCKWPEIECTADGNVTGINFGNLNFTVSLPNTICDFPNLRILDLSYNYFPGEFPTFLYNCTKLRYLNLSQNYFAGPIPDDIDRLSGELEYLDLGANNFSGDIPRAIGRLSKLKVLNLYQCEYNGSFPADIGNLSELEELRMAHNHKLLPVKIPAEFGNLKKLRYLWLEEMNLIGEIPAAVFENLTALEHVDLSINNLTGRIPDSLFRLKNLTRLYLFANDLTGEIPKIISGVNILEIDFSVNKLNGSIPEAFGNLTRLEYLGLFINQLSGEIPAGIGKLSRLRRLKLFTNKLTGDLPADIGSYSKLEEFDVSDNQLTGKIPGNLCRGDALLGVVMFSNNFTGEIPKSLGNCQTLRTIQLYNNGFSGDFPSGIWTCSDMISVLVSNNWFTGELPEKIAQNLSRIQIENNRFSGEIPHTIGTWSRLSVFTAGNNMFTGKIPTELTFLPDLETLSLEHNELSGELPKEIVSWKSLTILDLSNNKFSGQIPAALGSLPNLLDLDLSENQFSGEIPPVIGKLKLTALNLSSNRLHGKIPDQFDNLAYENSFLNNSELCVDSPIFRFPDCRSMLRRSKGLPQFVLALVLVITVLVFAVTVLATFFIIRDYSRKKHRSDLETWKLTSFHVLDFSESDILSNLTENNLIGSGGFGKVYKIFLNSSSQSIAVKRIWKDKKLDQKLEKEFIAEVLILGKIRHANIVKLLCCISSQDSKLLVYEYMENRSLDMWLHKKKRGYGTYLDWPTRLKIAVGAAQGLSYMHHGCSPAIIHRDVKSSNILLDSEFNAKIADFGLAKMLIKHGEDHTMSVVAGSFGYIAPEYAYTAKVNEKIDLYSFGVVLLELVTGREGNYGDEHLNLADWSWRHYVEGKPIQEAFDEDIKDPSCIEEMTTVFKLGLLCTSKSPNERPSMKEVLHVLHGHSPAEAQSAKKRGTEVHNAPFLFNLAGRIGSKRVEAEDLYVSTV